LSGSPSAPRQVVVLSQEEARTLLHDYIGPEHILLGLRPRLLEAARQRKDDALEAGETEAAQKALAEERRLQAEVDDDPMRAARSYLGL
jgi:hypothetical protein